MRFALFVLPLVVSLSAMHGPPLYRATALPESPVRALPQDAPPFLALHLYNPASEYAHREFLGVLRQFNDVIAETGLTDAHYQVWKVSGDQAGEYGYLFGSIWPNRAVYDTVHSLRDYKAVMERMDRSGLEPFRDEIYNRYVLLNPIAGENPAMPIRGPQFMSLRLFNLDSQAHEDELVGILHEANAAIAEAGHPETRYGLWKVVENQDGDFGYLFGSQWADRAAYDDVHQHPAFVSFSERRRERVEELVGDDVYNRFERVELE